MMRGRGGSGGRGPGGRRGADDFGITRTGPITEEVPAYPHNPLLTKAEARLTDEQQQLVALNRILANYWKFQSPFQVQERPAISPAETFSDMLRQTRFAGPQAQKEAIIACSNPRLFPEELLQERYVPPRLLNRQVAKRKVVTAATLADENGEEKTGNDEGRDGFWEGAAEDAQDFGGDDYAVDHEAENDDDGDDGGGDDGAF